MLSISVAVLLVIQVGLVIVGTRPSDRFAEMNLSVGACFVDFNRSKLWSRPSTIPLFSLFFRSQTNLLYWSINSFSGEFGGL